MTKNPSADAVTKIFDVIIVGGGPIGATLAGYLGQRGLQVLLFEQGDGNVVDARMHHVNIRSSEILRSLGLEDEIRACGWPLDHPQDIVFVTKIDGEEIARIPWPSINEMRPPESSPTISYRCPQAWFNPIVTAFARRQETVTLRHYCRAERITEESDVVVVEATDLETGEHHSFRARYLVGCDGPRGTIQDIINSEKEQPTEIGRSAEIIFRSRTLQDVSKFGRVGRYIFVGEEGAGATLLAFDGVNQYRFVMLTQPDRLTEEDVLLQIQKCANADLNVELMTPILPWINRLVSAPKYASKRIALAGDSAHGMPPTGGFGMNTGFVDLFDLGWRLEGLVRGWGGPHLMSTYTKERRVGVARIQNMAATIYQDWVDWGAQMRDAGERLKNDQELTEFRRQAGRALARTLFREFNSIGGPLGYRYESEILIPDGTPETKDDILEYIQTARPGHRAPHAWISENMSTLDLFGKGFVLLTFEAGSATENFAEQAKLRGIPLQVVTITDEEIAALYERAFVLVRPDGIVAWRSDALPKCANDLLATVTGH